MRLCHFGGGAFLARVPGPRSGPREVVEYNQEGTSEGAILAFKTMILAQKRLLLE
jgi:hypothetical protein